MESLLAWKNSPGRKPLLLKGARQVGKTWLMKEFGKISYQNTVYIDFYNNQQARRLFDGDLKPQRIIEELGFISGESILPGQTLIIFDEIQECNRGLNSLKYFYEEASDYHIIAAGSFLGIALHQDESFPVGKTDSLILYPMTFLEFLNALNDPSAKAIGAASTMHGSPPVQQLVAAVSKREPRLIALVRDELVKSLKYYFYVGGMPEVVSDFTTGKNFKTTRAIQKRIISDYEDDFSKHIGTRSAERVIRLWNSIPHQLARESKKFIYNDIKPGAKSHARSRDYRSSLFWLIKCGLVYEVSRVTLPHYPLASYAEPDHFKLFMLDIGLLSAMAGLDIEAFLERDPAVFNHFYGALAEQYVLGELKALNDISVYYWAREGSAKAEVDFLIQAGNKIIPLEVKAERNLKAKSLKLFIDTYAPSIAIRSSLADMGQSNYSGATVYDIPLYMIGGLASFP
jgi:predicted AAA+ superfamily ATPase